MKRTTIIFGLLVALLTSTVTLDARTRRHSSASSRSSIPDASKVIGCEYRSASEVKARSGLDLLYEYNDSFPDPDEPEITCYEYFIYCGKDAKLNKKGDKIIVKANGPHAFYYYFEHYIAAGSDWARIFAFKNKADHDKFYKQLLKEVYSRDELYKTKDDGWYIISMGEP